MNGPLGFDAEMARLRRPALRADLAGRAIRRKPDDPEQWEELFLLDARRLRRLAERGVLIFDARGDAVMRT